MGARDKLNALAAWGCLIASALLGAALQSWLAFAAALALAVAGCTAAGAIHPRPDDRPRGGRRSRGRHERDRRH